MLSRASPILPNLSAAAIPVNMTFSNLTLSTAPCIRGRYKVPFTSTTVVYTLYKHQPLPLEPLTTAIWEMSDHFMKYVISGNGNEAIPRYDDPYVIEADKIHLHVSSGGRGELTSQVVVEAMWGLNLLIRDPKKRCITFFNNEVGEEKRTIGSGFMGNVALKDKYVTARADGNLPSSS